MLQKSCVSMLKFKLLLTPHTFRDTPLAKRNCNIKIYENAYFLIHIIGVLEKITKSDRPLKYTNIQRFVMKI